MRRTRRPLGPEEMALWSEIINTVRPIRRRGRPAVVAQDNPVLPPKLMAARPALPEKLPDFEFAARAAKEPRIVVPAPKDATLRMDARAYVRMRRGRLAPEARIDLHGMTVAEAHSALIAFVLRAHGSGLRLVLVITGKGKSGSDPSVSSRGGVLRHQVPHWLQLPPLTVRVLQVAEAHISHGGAGALYVYLRRSG